MVVCMYAGLNSYEKGTVGIIGNRKKTESGKKGKRKQKFLWLKNFVKWQQKKILKTLKFFEMVKKSCIC